MQDSNRVLIIGLDGATWDVLLPWMDDGTLPNLDRLRWGGSWGVLRSTIPPISAPAWSTFMTGKQPGKHGVFHFADLFGEEKNIETKPAVLDARSIKTYTMWDVMGHLGRRVVLINIPMTYPPRPVNGVMITGLLTPKNAPVFTHPPELGGTLTDYVIDLDRFIDKKPGQEGTFAPEATTPDLSLVQDFRDMLDKRLKTSRSMLMSHPWDFFVVVFTGPDRMGHYLWPYHRLNNEDPLPASRELYEAVRQYYVCLDEAVGDLVREAGEDVTVIVMSDHGMGPPATKRVHLNNWLFQKGWLSPERKESGAGLDTWLIRIGLPRDKIGRLVRRVPGLSKSRLIQKVKSRPGGLPDVEQSQAYCVPIFNTVAGIQINLKGDSKTALAEEIMQSLEEIIDPTTGEQVVQKTYWGRDLYHGPFATHVPDIVVVMKPDYNYSYHLRHYSSIVTEIQIPLQSAFHRLEGIFIASGSSIIANPEPCSNLSIADIAPTVLYLMDMPVPRDMDGRVLTDIIASTVTSARSVEIGDPVGFWPNKDQVIFSEQALSDEDDDQIRARLRSLGYIE